MQCWPERQKGLGGFAFVSVMSDNSASMNRPKGLTLTVILMVVCNAMLWTTIRPGRPPYTSRMWVAFTVLIGVGYFAIWSYWKGRGWARIGILLVSGISIYNLASWHKFSAAATVLATPAHVMMATRAILGAALLYYLNTRPVLEFFYPENASPKLGVGRILFGFWIITRNTKDYAMHPVATLVGMLVGLCVIAWGVRAQSITLRHLPTTSTPLTSGSPKP